MRSGEPEIDSDFQIYRIPVFQIYTQASEAINENEMSSPHGNKVRDDFLRAAAVS